MQTTDTSTSNKQIHTNLSDFWTKHYPQCKDIRSNGEEKEETNKEEQGKKKDGEVEKYGRHAKSLNRP